MRVGQIFCCVAWATALCCVLAQEPVVSVDNLDFPQFFVAHAVPGVPAIVKRIDQIDRIDLWSTSDGQVVDPADSQALPASLLSIIHSCYEQDTSGPVKSRCPSVAARLIMPRITVNDYMLRLRGPAFISSSSATRQWPALQRLSGTAGQATLQCPYSMHMLITVIDGAIGATLLPSAASDAALHTSSAEALAVSRATARAQGENATADVSQGDALFVPSGYTATVVAATDVTLLQHCYVDASNFNRVKATLAGQAEAGDTEQLALLAALDSPSFDTSMRRMAEGEVLQALWDNVYTSLPSSGTTSSASASSSSSSSSGGDEASGGGGLGARRPRKSFREWQDASRWNHLVLSLTLPIPGAPRVTSISRRTASLEWASTFEQRKDDQSEVRFNVTWCPIAQTSAAAAAAAASAIAPASAAAPSGGGACDGGGFAEVSLAAALAEASAAAAVEASGLVVTRQGGARRLAHALENAPLMPGTLYTFQVALTYGAGAAASTPFSPPSAPALTLPVTVPSGMAALPVKAMAGTQAVTLAIDNPADDGGAPVQFWHVVMQVGERAGREWEFVGVFPATQVPPGVPHWTTDSVVVNNLAPGVPHTFAACAQNAVGTSDWSRPSAPVTPAAAAAGDAPTALARRQLAVQGIHANAPLQPLPTPRDPAVRYADFGGAPIVGLHAHAERMARGPTVTLDAARERVHVADDRGPLAIALGGADVPVWAGHFSPRTHLVTAELIPADPPDAAAPELRNASFVRGRVALVTRGAVPLVHKVMAAQRARALAVVIADDGSCTHAGGFSQFCMPGSNPPDGWAREDSEGPWREVRIPHVLMLKEHADVLLAAVPESGRGQAAAPGAADDVDSTAVQ